MPILATLIVGLTIAGIVAFGMLVRHVVLARASRKKAESVFGDALDYPWLWWSREKDRRIAEVLKEIKKKDVLD